MKRKILFGILVSVVLVQFIQPTKNLGNLDSPDDIHQALEIPPVVSSILKQSCYDCHSNRTKYPIYANLTPLNWWMADHVADGKAELNFSVFKNYSLARQTGTLEAIAETVKSDIMPLPSYVLMHPDAKLTPTKKLAVFNWAIASNRNLKN
ncbi:MAG TPA: heme-binding domain-containing protein [Flavisolibacter sp.]|jgi:hypothetical protein